MMMWDLFSVEDAVYVSVQEVRGQAVTNLWVSARKNPEKLITA